MSLSWQTWQYLLIILSQVEHCTHVQQVSHSEQFEQPSSILFAHALHILQLQCRAHLSHSLQPSPWLRLPEVTITTA